MSRIKYDALRIVFVIYLLLGGICIDSAIAVERTPTISDREIIEKLARIEEGQKAILREMDKRFESIDKRSESIDKRFESIDKRFESIDKRFDQLINIFIGIVASFAGIVAVTIGFAIWDRRTALTPVIRRAIAIEDREERLERALKEYAQKEPALAEILKGLGML